MHDITKKFYKLSKNFRLITYLPKIQIVGTPVESPSLKDSFLYNAQNYRSIAFWAYWCFYFFISRIKHNKTHYFFNI